MKKLVSIIIPTYNSEKDIEDAIISVLNQTYTNKELLIIDGRSTDNTVNIIKKYSSQLTYWVSEKDKGIYDAMNKGIVKAQGDYLYFMGSDDRFYNHHVLSKIFDQQETADFIYGDVIWKSSGEQYDGPFVILKLKEKNICHQSIFYKKSLFKKHGLFDLQWKVLADWDFNLKCFTYRKLIIKYTPEIIAIFNDKGTSDGYSETGFYSYKNSLIYNFVTPWYSLDRIRKIARKIKNKLISLIKS